MQYDEQYVALILALTYLWAAMGSIVYTNLQKNFGMPVGFAIYKYGASQISAWQSATLLPISCNSVQSVPARIEEPVSPVRQSSTGGATNNPTFPKMA